MIAKGFLFDLDGTLINSEASATRAWLQVAQEAGIPFESLLGLHGIPADGIMRRLLTEHTESEIVSYVQRVTELEIQEAHDVYPMEGALELLAELDDRQIPWTVVTSGTMPLATARATAAGIPWPDHAVTFDQVKRGKPFPDPFLLGAQRINIAPSHCIAVEDAPGGITSAKAAGCFVAAVSTTHPREMLMEADLAIDSLLTLVKQLP